MKSCTDIEQSKKLAEIIPPESADMCWTNHCYGSIRSSMTVSSKTIEEYKELLTRFGDLTNIDVFYPCWSLAALFDVLPKTINHNTLFIETSPALWHIGYRGTYIARSENLIDACYEMILELHELKIL